LQVKNTSVVRVINLTPGSDNPTQGPGFSIRFTVQFNLFAGTVLELGGPGHLAMLEDMQAAGTLGCFALTERLAGEGGFRVYSLQNKNVLPDCLHPPVYVCARVTYCLLFT
jgi:hypothetical protein